MSRIPFSSDPENDHDLVKQVRITSFLIEGCPDPPLVEINGVVIPCRSVQLRLVPEHQPGIVDLWDSDRALRLPVQEWEFVMRVRPGDDGVSVHTTRAPNYTRLPVDYYNDSREADTE